MPFGVKNPHLYTSKKTNVVLRPDVPGRCTCCSSDDKALAPIHIKSLTHGCLIAALVCQICYLKHRKMVDWTFEELQMRKRRGKGRPKTINTNAPMAKTNDLSDLRTLCVVKDRITELRSLATQLLIIANELERDRSTTHTEPSETVSEPSKTVSELSPTRQKAVSELSPTRQKAVSELAATLDDDDDLEFGMTEEQRARMNAAVATAKSHEGMIVTEKGYENVEDKIKNW